MKRQQFYLPRSGKLVTQLPEGVTFAYDLRLRRSRDRYKGPSEEHNAETRREIACYSFSLPARCQKNIV